MSITQYWTYDKTSLIVNPEPVSAIRHSLIPEYPRDALIVEPLPVKEGNVVLAYKFVDGRPTSTKYIPDYRMKTMFSTTTKAADIVTEIGPLPDGWTLLEPPQDSSWDGTKWVVQLDLAKARKRAEINNWRIQQETGKDLIVVYNDHNWNASPVAFARIKDALLSTYTPPYWTDADDNDVAGITRDDLVAIIDKIVEKGFEIHARQRDMKKEIEAMTRASDVQAYIVGWPTP